MTSDRLNIFSLIMKVRIEQDQSGRPGFWQSYVSHAETGDRVRIKSLAELAWVIGSYIEATGGKLSLFDRLLMRITYGRSRGARESES